MTGIVQNARALLLDTCAIIRLGERALSTPAISAIMYAALADGVHVSPVSAWEVGLLADPGRGTRALVFQPDVQSWFAKLMSMTAITPAPLTNTIAIASSQLPGNLHRDPADRLLVATARMMGWSIMTSDRKIIAYAKAGYVAAMPL